MVMTPNAIRNKVEGKGTNAEHFRESQPALEELLLPVPQNERDQAAHAISQLSLIHI